MIETKRLAELAAAPYNPRTISDPALAGLRASLEEFGVLEPIVWNRRTGHIVGGHQRAKALAAAGVVETDVVVVDLDEPRERMANLALNSSAISGDWTAQASAEVERAAREMPDLAAALRMGELGKELRDLFPPAKDALEDDLAPAPPKVPTTRKGDVWVLGRHRLLCGDATVEADVLRARGELAPFMMVTDPPYGVSYDPDWRTKAPGLWTTGGKVRDGKVTNDDRVDWTDAWKLFAGDVAYVWHSALHGSEVLAHLAAAELFIRAQIIWRKPYAPISRGAYHWQHEPCWYSVRKGKPARWTGDRMQSTVWDVTPVNEPYKAHPSAEDMITEHGTQKPLECMGRPMRNHGVAGDVVYDPFAGSGTTLIAAEELDRSCVAIEIEPGYCDVIVSRWEKRSGKKADRNVA